MRKLVLFISIIVFAISCKPTTKDLLVGVWHEQAQKNDISNYDYVSITFNNNGTGVFTVTNKYGELKKFKDFTYKLFDNKTMQTTYAYNPTEEWQITNLRDNFMALMLNGYGVNLIK